MPDQPSKPAHEERAGRPLAVGPARLFWIIFGAVALAIMLTSCLGAWLRANF